MYVRLLDTPADAAREIGREDAAVRFGLGAAPGAGTGGISGEIRAHDSRTLRHDGNDDEYLKSVCGGAAAGQRRLPASRASRRGLTIRASCILKAPTFSRDTGSGKTRHARRFSDGWFKTGDIATRSEDGYYTLCGRRSDLIISGGFNIYPREIEEFLAEQPEIAEAAVVGESGPRARRDPGRLYCAVGCPVRRGLRSGVDRGALPGEAGFLQSSSAVRGGGKTAAECTGQSAETSFMSRILMVASEAAPFAKTGGLADVMGSLPAGARPPGR